MNGVSALAQLGLWLLIREPIARRQGRFR